MPIIYTYPSATPVVEDLLIFSDVSATDPAKDTRKCTIGDIVTLVTASVPGGGTVTSVELQLNSTGLTTSGGTSQTIVGTGSFDIAGTLVVYNGGTGAGALTGVIHGNGSGPYTASNVVLTSEVTGILPILNGGTGQSTYTKGQLLFYNTGGVGGAQLDKLTIGAPNQVLTASAGGLPVWNSPATVSVTSVDVSGGSTGLTFSGGPVGPGTGTITMAGTLLVQYGGTGANSLTIGCPLLGNNTGAITSTAPMTDGQLLIGNTGNPPTLSALTAGASGNVTITNSPGGIVIEAVGGGVGTVTSVGTSNAMGVSSGITFVASTNPIVATGTIDLSFAGTIGDILYADTATSLAKLVAATATHVLTSNGPGVAPSWQAAGGGGDGNGIYDGSGSLSGATVVTTGANNLTFTATTGDVIFNNSVAAANPAFFIDGTTSTVGMGGNANLTDQCSIYNVTGSGNTTSLGIQGNNTTGTQKGININVSGASTENIGLEITSSSATKNYALVTDGGNSGFGTTSPEESAIVEMATTTQGFLPPRMTTLQMNAISAPATGLMVYDTTTNQWMGYNGTSWVIIG